MMVDASGRGVSETSVKTGGFYNDGILMPDILILVGHGVEGIKRCNPIDPYSDGTESGRCFSPVIDRRVSWNLKHKILIGGNIGISRPGADRIPGAIVPADVDTIVRVPDELNVCGGVILPVQPARV